MRYSLISLNACWQALSQMNETPFFINLVKGWQCPEKFDINLQIYANHSCKPLSFLRFLEDCNPLDGADFLQIPVNFFRCNDKSKEFATGYPQEGLGWVHLQLKSAHDVEHSSQAC